MSQIQKIIIVIILKGERTLTVHSNLNISPIVNFIINMDARNA